MMLAETSIQTGRGSHADMLGDPGKETCDFSESMVFGAHSATSCAPSKQQHCRAICMPLTYIVVVGRIGQFVEKRLHSLSFLGIGNPSFLHFWRRVTSVENSC